MKIVRTTYRFAAAGGRDETRETLRFGIAQAKGKRKPLRSNARALIPQGVNSNRLRYTKTTGGQPPEDGEACHLSGKKRNASTWRTGRSAWRERAQKDMSETWETRASRRDERASQFRECITWSGPRRESDGLIVALKRGNARGAKEPCCTHAFIHEARAA